MTPVTLAYVVLALLAADAVLLVVIATLLVIGIIRR